jgi:Mg-chelatase subunit ChlD
MNMRHELLSEAVGYQAVLLGNDASRRRWSRTWLTALALAAGSMVLLAALRAPLPTLAQTSGCTAQMTRTVSPKTLTLGEEATVTTIFQADCSKSASPLHVVFALDVSGSMAGKPLTDTVAVLQSWTRDLLADQSVVTRVGLVAFNDAVVRRCGLTQSVGVIDTCLEKLPVKGGSDIAKGITESLTVLADGRRGIGPAVTPNEVMIVLSDGANNLGCDPVKSAARRAKGQAVLMVTVCIGAACDAQCMRECASSERYHFQIEQANEVVDMLRKVRSSGIGSGLRRLTLHEDLAPNLEYVAESAIPTGAWDTAAGRLSWELASVPSGPLTVIFRFRPLQVGTLPSGRASEASFTDLQGATGTATAAIEPITVLPNGSEPRPAIRSSLVLERDSLALGQRSAVTATLDMTLPEPPGNTHLALVADRSGSMSGDPMVKLIQGARGMLDRLESVAVDDFAAAIVRFNSVPDLLCDLTGDFSLLRACVDGIDPAEGGTNIAFGLQEGHKALKPGTAWHGGKDLVVFTDGQNNTGCDPVRAAANAIKADGVVVHAVCLGSGCDAFCMQQAASSPRHFFDVPLSADLPQAFDGIAQDLLARRGVEGVNLLLKVPPHLRLVPDSFSVEPDLVDQAGVHFNLPRLPQGGLRLTFAVEAVAGGKGVLELESNLPMLRAATLSGQTQSKPLDVPVTPTLPAVTATLVEPTATATLAPSTTPTPKPDSGRAAIFLPLVLSEAHQAEPVDLVLVIDSSLSMGERLGAEGSKLEAAQAAVDALLSALDLKRHRVALVATDAAARRLQPLGHDGEAFRGVLAQLQLGGGTALDQGLDLATEMLLGDERRGMTRGVILLLSDGRAHEAAPEDAVAAADRARRLKLEVYAVGLGREVDARTLSAIADSPERYQAAPDRAAALRAFGRAAAWMDCPAEAVWGGR